MNFCHLIRYKIALVHLQLCQKRQLFRPEIFFLKGFYHFGKRKQEKL